MRLCGCVRWTRLVIFGIWVGLVGAGCGGASGDDDDDEPLEVGSESVSLEEYPTRIAETHCGMLFECCSSTERPGILLEAEIDLSSEQNCKDTYAATIRSEIPDIRRAREDGRAAYDPAAAGVCISDLEAKSCSEVATGGFLEGCEKIIEPGVELGGSCEGSFECKRGMCDYDSSTCRQPADGGAECSEVGCRDGYYCGASEVCKPEKDVGDTCDLGSNVCKSAVCESGTCAPKYGGGERCEWDVQCQSGICNKGQNADEGTCLGTPVCDGR